MNRTSLVITAVLVTATTVFSQANFWDGYTSGYDGAFGLADKSSPDFSTATQIYTIQTPVPGNAGGTKALGYFRYINPVSATITVTNSFDGLLQFVNVSPSAGLTLDIVSDGSTEVRGADAATKSDNPAAALQIAGGAAKKDVFRFSQGNYKGGAGMGTLKATDAALVNKLDKLIINNSSWTGGNGISGTNTAAVTAQGGNAASVNDVALVSVTNGATVAGGRGGKIFMNAAGPRVETFGGNGINMNGTAPTQKLAVDGSSVMGGDGGDVSALNGGNAVKADGGFGIQAANITLSLKNATVIGGAAGDIDATTSTQTDAIGGTAVRAAAVNVNSLEDGVVITGGAGGNITTSGAAAPANATGGDALVVASLFSNLEINGGVYTGGAGGSASGESATANAIKANGGNGLAYVGTGSSSPIKTIITGGEFTGGTGGDVKNSAAEAQSIGGAAVFFVNGVADISGGTFNGGAAGTVNGTAGVAGAGIKIQDSAVNISGGTFTGTGLLGASLGGGNKITVTGGSFTDAEFTGNNTVTISGGSFTGDFLFSGSGTKTADISNIGFGSLTADGSGANNLTLGGTSSFGDLYLGGTGANTLSLSNAVTSSGVVMQSGGKTTVNAWNNGNFMNTTLSGGSMSFNGRGFDLQSGNQFVMSGAATRANFNGGVTLRGNSTLDIGLGQVSAPTLTAETGSQLRTQFSDETGSLQTGLIAGDDLTFNNGLTWTLYGSAAALENIKLASASNSLTSTISASNIKLLNNPEWIQGINGVVTNEEAGVYNLYASYGVLAINDALDAGGNLQFEKALTALDTLMLPFNRNLVSSWSKGEAEYNLYNGYVRTPEMANTLIRLQSVFNDQIKDRTRSYLRFKNWGTSAFHAPQGAAGPQFWYEDSKAWLNDHLPTWDAQSDMRRAADKLPEPSLSQEKPVAQKPFVANSGNSSKGYNGFVEWYQSWLPTASADEVQLPATYQVWGRGYGASMKQDRADQHEGYDASIGGAVVGLDKRFNNLLLGLGGGAAHSSVDGKGADNDGSADTVNVVAYAAMNGERSFIDANVNYAYSAVETDGIDALAYTGKYDAQAVSMYLGGGLAFTAFKDSVLFTPEASLLTTYYDRESFTESSELLFPAKNWGSYDQWSYLSSVGATLSMIRQIEAFNIEMEFQPEIRAHWLHEFNNDMDDPTYSMVPGSQIGVDLQAREEDLVKVGAGIRFSKWASDTLEFGLDVDGTFGDDYTAYAISGKLMHRF